MSEPARIPVRIAITIPGEPVAQGRPQAGRWKAADGRSGISLRDPKKSRSWKGEAAAMIRAEAGQRGLFGAETPVRVDILAVFACPAGDYRKTIPRPRRWMVGSRNDVDNVAKAVLDACTRAGLWADDGQVVDLTIRKIRGAQGEMPRVEIIATEAGPIDLF